MSTQDKSSKIKEAIHQGFLDGTSKFAGRKCYGYDRDIDGMLAINQEESENVQYIFESYRDGSSLGKIAKGLEKRSISSPTGKEKWSREAIYKILSNEKYVGSVLLQKTISEYGCQVKNRGKHDRVLIRNHHPAIISEALFEVVQSAKLKRSKDSVNGPEIKTIF